MRESVAWRHSVCVAHLLRSGFSPPPPLPPSPRPHPPNHNSFAFVRRGAARRGRLRGATALRRSAGPPPARTDDMGAEAPARVGGAGAEAVGEARRPPPMAPRFLLALFVLAGLVTYMDRGAIASNGVNSDGIQKDFGLSDFEDGILASAFMFGLVAAAPVFAEATKYYDGFLCMFVGLLIWCGALVFCATSVGYKSLVAARAMVGVGEASFVCLAAPFIDAVAPPGSRSSWLAVFYATIPVGVALGYAYGGIVTGACGLTWRWALLLEAVIMAPIAVVCLVQGTRGIGKKVMALAHANLRPQQADEVGLPTEESVLLDPTALSDVDVQAATGAGGPRGDGRRPRAFSGKLGDALSGFFGDLKDLLSNAQYTGVTCGYSIYSQVVGAYAFWGPKAGKEAYDVPNADLVFAALIAGTSLVGTILGGFLLDSMPGGGTVANAARFCALVSAVGGVICMAAFAFDVAQKVGFFVVFGVGSMMVFSATGPINSATIWVVQGDGVKPTMQSLAMSVSTVCVHVFGDVPSPPLVGLIQDHLHNWRITVPAISSLFLVASSVWLWTSRSAKRKGI